MMSYRNEKKQDLSDVEVTFNDGEVKTYMITASPAIAGYLAREAGSTGFLTLWKGDESHSIPIGNIREFKIKSVPPVGKKTT